MTSRLLMVSLLFVGTAAYRAHAMRPEQVPLRESIEHLPQAIGRWDGRDAAPMTKEILTVLGVDEYVSRWYQTRGEGPVSLYVGYYESQREGDTIHSPMNCLPGAGWEPVSTGRAELVVSGRTAPIEVNRFVIQKGIDKQVVLYWYQSHGRVVASEYWSKIFMVYDAVRQNRSDAALVRVMSPVLSTDADQAGAERRVTEFVQALFPELSKLLPS
jgi:EpsI family protein